MRNSDIAAQLEQLWHYGTRRISVDSQALPQNATASRPSDGVQSTSNAIHESQSAPNLRQRVLRPGQTRRPSAATVEGPSAVQPPAENKPKRAVRVRRSVSMDSADPETTLGPVPLGRPPRPDAPARTSLRGAAASQQRTKDYAERRKAWRDRLEAAMAAPRLYTVPVPASRGSRASSTQTTPSGSPKKSTPLATAALEGEKEGSPSAGRGVWAGYTAAAPPQDFSALSDADLRLFLAQAGMAPAGEVPESHEELVAAARAARGAWEVARVVVGCTAPEDVLRVSKDACGDMGALRAAWKRVALVLHPDKCAAEGAEVAMAIAKDAFELLALRAGGEAAERPVPSGQNGAAAGAGAGRAGSGAGEAAAAGGPYGGGSGDGRVEVRAGTAGLPPQQPLKVRVKLKAASSTGKLRAAAPPEPG